MLSGVIAQLSLSDQDKQSGEAQDTASPNMTMEVDWDLGVSGHSHDITEEDEVRPILPATKTTNLSMSDDKVAPRTCSSHQDHPH